MKYKQVGYKNGEPIYERLAPGDLLILTKLKDGSLEVVENLDGKAVMRRIHFELEEQKTG